MLLFFLELDLSFFFEPLLDDLSLEDLGLLRLLLLPDDDDEDVDDEDDDEVSAD